MARPQREYWKEAIRGECNSILRNNTFVAMGTAVSTDMSTGNRPIESKWGIQDKVKPDGSVRHKAQLVIIGYMQPD